MPSKVTIGSTFGLRGIVINNSTATITFANGTCTSPLSITFNKNVISEPQTTTASCQAKQITLKPGEQTHILSPNLSGITYKPKSPGITNATMIFKFEAAPPASKSSVSESHNRVYTFNIMPPDATPTSSPSPTTTHSVGVMAYLLSMKEEGLSYAYRNVAFSAIKHYHVMHDIILNWEKLSF